MHRKHGPAIQSHLPQGAEATSRPELTHHINSRTEHGRHTNRYGGRSWIGPPSRRSLRGDTETTKRVAHSWQQTNATGLATRRPGSPCTLPVQTSKKHESNCESVVATVQASEHAQHIPRQVHRTRSKHIPSLGTLSKPTPSPRVPSSQSRASRLALKMPNPKCQPQVRETVSKAAV